MVIPSSDEKCDVMTPGTNSYRRLEIAVPVLSFGGAAAAVLFLVLGVTLDFRVSVLGCLFASCILAYLAWIRPKKDIVALSTPIYSFIFFTISFTDVVAGIVLELLFALSLTVLLVRLRARFGSPGSAVTGSKELTGSLLTYTEKTRDLLRNTRPDQAHRATLAFVRFAQGEYEEAALVAGTAAGTMENSGINACLIRAFQIIREHATLLHTSLPRPQAFRSFFPEDMSLLAHPVPVSPDRDQEFYTNLDNALLLLFSTAWNASEQDHPHLLGCQSFAQKLMGPE